MLIDIYQLSNKPVRATVNGMFSCMKSARARDYIVR